MNAIRYTIPLFVLVSSCGWSGYQVESSANMHESKQNSVQPVLVFSYANDGCSFDVSPVSFCDEVHSRAFRAALEHRVADFNGHYKVVSTELRPEYHQRSLAVVDIEKGTVFPVPIDMYSGAFGHAKAPREDGEIVYALNQDKLCIKGAILVYRAIQDGSFCFRLVGEKFVGYRTEYMYEGRHRLSGESATQE